MNRLPNVASSIRSTLADGQPGHHHRLHGAARSVGLDDVLSGTCLGGRINELVGRSVVIDTRDQFAAALALIELDGTARRLILCPPDLAVEHRRAVVEKAEADAIVSDRRNDDADWPVPRFVMCHGSVTPALATPAGRFHTEWVLMTSGTTGAPKMVAHTFDTLTAPIRNRTGRQHSVVWGTFYDIRRYGGLQILLRAVLGHASFVVSGVHESTASYLLRLGRLLATHISGTPSHWRRALMSAEARAIAPRYVRLSGEIADQGILNALRACYPHARIGHAFASTEAGVGFEVDDGLEGFPASIVGNAGEVQIGVEGSSLRIRSERMAVRLVGDDARLVDEGGFVDTGDIVERRGDRYYFLGRRSGIINVGGLKVYPEEVESAINRHPAVRMSMVRPAKSSIVGSLVAADIVLEQTPDVSADAAAFKREILQICIDTLAPHKVPATIRFVPTLEFAAAGKLARHA
jgi:acyl-coenzyme A synthetase/AMP-(fatty) acid ligase